MKVLRSIATLASAAALAVSVPASKAEAMGAEQAQIAVDRFLNGCIETLPDFKDLPTKALTNGFKAEGNIWMLDTQHFQIIDRPDRKVCWFGVIGNHADALREELEMRLGVNKLGRFEAKSAQGRVLYLLQAKNGLTILEVVPPKGASTFILANSRK